MAWLTTAARAEAASESVATHLAAGLAALLLAAGVVAQHAGQLALARALLSCAFPASLGLGLALAALPATLDLVVPASASLLAFLTVAARLTNAPLALLASASHPTFAATQEPARGLRRVVTYLLLLAAPALGVVAPLLPVATDAPEPWGDAAQWGHVLTAVVAAALALVIAGAFLPSLLRAADAEPPVQHGVRNTRVALSLAGALLSATVYYVIAP